MTNVKHALGAFALRYLAAAAASLLLSSLCGGGPALAVVVFLALYGSAERVRVLRSWFCEVHARRERERRQEMRLARIRAHA